MQDHLREARLAVALRARRDTIFAMQFAADPRDAIEKAYWLSQERKAALLASPDLGLWTGPLPAPRLPPPRPRPCVCEVPAGACDCDCAPRALACGGPHESPPDRPAPSTLQRAIARIVERARRDPLFAIAARGLSGAWRHSATWLPPDEHQAVTRQPIKRIAGLVAAGLANDVVGALSRVVPGDVTSLTAPCSCSPSRGSSSSASGS